MKYAHLEVELDGPTAMVALNRPEVRNAMDDETIAELQDCFSQLARATGCRVVVLKGNGPMFCAGADLRWMKKAAAYSPAKNRKDAKALLRMISAIDDCPLPVIGRAHAGVYGGGMGLIAACDIVVAEEGTRFKFSEVRLGIVPGVISPFVLPKIGIGHARRLFLTGETFGTELALRTGIIHEVARAGELDGRVGALAAELLQGGPGAQRRAKGFLSKMSGASRPERIKLAVDALIEARSSDEGKEGFASFLEKRPPSWR